MLLKAEVIGNLGRDAVINNIQGKTVINFSVAHTEKYKDAGGQQMEKTTWISCSYWSDKTSVAGYMKKGMMVFVAGYPEAEKYKDKNGDVQVQLKFRVTQIKLLSSKKDDGPIAQGGAQDVAELIGAGESGDDLPF